MNDPLVEEIRRIRDEHAANFNYDLDAIYRDIKEQELKSGHKFVDGVARPTASRSAPQLSAPVITPTDHSDSTAAPPAGKE